MFLEENTREMAIPILESKTGDLDPEEKSYAFVLLSGGQAGRTFPVGDQTVIGRDAQCTVSIDELGVSRRHASVERRSPNEFVVSDLQSRNGTFVNGLRIREQVLRLGDRVSVGAETVLVFTQRGRLEEQILHQQRMEAIGRLAGGIAHDFNNFLGAVLGNISVLLNAEPNVPLGDTEVNETLLDIKLATQRASELTQQLLLFARRSPTSSRPTDISELTQEVIRMCRRTFARNAAIEPAVAPEISVRGDPAQLHQVLMNLMINARDAMPSGGTIKVSLGVSATGPLQLPAGEPCVLLSVTDTGVGMDEATRQRIFEPFFTTKSVGHGTGLGLATAYGIVSAHGGQIRVRSTPGKGSTFEVFLPQLARESRERISAAPKADPRAPQRGLVLIVDDEELYIRTSSRLLQQCGYDVLIARDGREALEVFHREQGRVRLVLLDMLMPTMGGEETCRAMRDLDPNVRVVFVSGYKQPSMESIVRAGGNGFIGKPFDLQTLSRVTAEVLSK